MPSDAALEGRFSRNQSEFINLVQMFNQDEHVTRIAPGFTWLDTDASWPRKNIGFSEERWDEYRRLFRKLNIEAGISRSTDYPGTIFISEYGSGGAVGGSSEKGYVYSQHPLAPVLSSLDVIPANVYDREHHAIAFKALAKDWYLYREEY